MKAKRPGFTDERYSETEYYFENGESEPYATFSISYSTLLFSLSPLPLPPYWDSILAVVVVPLAKTLTSG